MSLGCGARWLARNLAPLTLLGSIAAYFHPPLFLVFAQSFLWFFAATMFAVGVVLEPVEVAETLRRPAQIVLGVLTQFVVMPVLGFAAALLAPVQPEIALGFIIVGCAPGAMASNVIVYLAGGAVAYSVALTTVATLAAPLLTPSLVQWLGGVFFEIPFWPMVQTILWTVVIPLLGGALVRHLLGVHVQQARDLAPALAAVAIVVICSYAVAANQARIAQVGLWVVAMVIIVNALGYAIGWWLGGLYRFNDRHRLTLAIEIGMQNAGLGVALALQHFDPATALPGALFAVWCILTAAGASAWLRRHPVTL
jgi:BASS family bile acid:Na+ symporter